MDFRLYFLTYDDHFEVHIEFECGDDASAIYIAKQHSSGRPFELWNRNRMVLRQFLADAV